MPQEKKRSSIKYRSFVICDDPRGVIECKTLKKSTIISPQKKEQPSNKIEVEKTQQNTYKSLDLLLKEDKEVKIGENNNGFEEKRFGFSQNDMKNVVRESLLGRNCVISNPVFEYNFENRKHSGSPDFPSSSSSQSSMIYSSNFGPSDYSSISSSSSSQRKKKGNGSNLIYKLIGLESFPSTPVRNGDSEKFLNLPKPMYDIDSPRARKSRFGAYDLGLKQNSMHEILGTLKNKGLLKSETVNGKPPIVVMKPLSDLRFLDRKEPMLPKFQRNKETLIKPKTYVNVNQKTEKKQETVRKVCEVMKVNSSRIKGEEKKITKSSDDDLRKNLISKDRRTSKRSKSSTQQEKDRQPDLMEGETEEIEDVYEDKVDADSQNGCVSLTVRRLMVENFPSDKQAEAYCATENDIEEQNSPSGPQENATVGSYSVEIHPEASRKFCAPTTKLKALILSSSSFVTRATELFDLRVNPDSVPPVVNEEEPELANTKLLLDCANEVMEFKSFKLSQACLPFPRSYYKGNTQNALSLDRFLDEICNGIEDLKGYHCQTRDGLFSETLNSLIDRDLGFKSGRAWDVGWKNAFSENEVEQVVSDIDKLILGILIEEILVDFML